MSNGEAAALALKKKPAKRSPKTGRRKAMKKRRHWVGWVLVVLIAAGFLACQTPAGRSPGDVIDDATITTKVKAKLFDDSLLRGIAISVETFEGEVTLTGAVDTPEQKRQAVEITRSVTGVKGVNDLLQLK